MSEKEEKLFKDCSWIGETIYLDPDALMNGIVKVIEPEPIGAEAPTLVVESVDVDTGTVTFKRI